MFFQNFQPQLLRWILRMLPGTDARKIVASAWGLFEKFSKTRPENFVFKGTAGLTGEVGLSNRGQSCFCNAVIQCLLNTPQFASLYIGKNLRNAVNVENPNGTEGAVTGCLSALADFMWNAEAKWVCSSPFLVSCFTFNIIGWSDISCFPISRMSSQRRWTRISTARSSKMRMNSRHCCWRSCRRMCSGLVYKFWVFQFKCPHIFCRSGIQYDLRRTSKRPKLMRRNFKDSRTSFGPSSRIFLPPLSTTFSKWVLNTF